MEEILSLASKLGHVGFPTLLIVILYASWKGEYLWKREVATREAVWLARWEEQQRAAEEWKGIALQAHGLAQLGLAVVQDKIIS